MKILLIKVSSMGDVIHTLPALTDASSIIADISFDWVVEEAFTEIPSWHPAVDKVIPIALRRWRKSLITSITSGELARFKKNLQTRKYDSVIDAQGLLKSALLTSLAQGTSFGLDKQSAKEPLSAYFYKYPQCVSWNQHAVERIRQLMAQSLNYSVPKTPGQFLLNKSHFISSHQADSPYIVFIHGTTRHDKHWPESYWCQLACIINNAGYTVLLPWGNDIEKERAKRIAESSNNSKVLPKASLSYLAGVLSTASGVVAVDTGLGHLSASLAKPTVSLYGETNPQSIGTYGESQIHLTIADCPSGTFSSVDPNLFASMTPKLVWDSLIKILPK